MEYRLISAVSGFPCLFDSNSSTYRDLNMRSDAWRQVAQIVGVPEAECRRKWKMLRDQHRRERYREKERRESGVGLLNYRPWRYSAILSFLNPFIDARVAGTNGWALDPRPARQTMQDAVGCTTTTETRSDEDDTYGIAVADATTTTSEVVQKKRLLSVGADDIRVKEAKLDLSPADQPPQPVNVRELYEMMMQTLTSLATSLASSHSDQSVVAVQSPCTPLRLLKAEEQEVTDAELLDPADDEYESPEAARSGRKSTGGPPEEYLRSVHDVDWRDHVSLFLLSLAPAIRRLPAEKQSWVKTKIQQFVHEAEFGPISFQ